MKYIEIQTTKMYNKNRQKVYNVTVSVIFLLSFACSNIEFPWDNLTLDEAINNHNKLIMIDFYATW